MESEKLMKMTHAQLSISKICTSILNSKETKSENIKRGVYEKGDNEEQGCTVSESTVDRKTYLSVGEGPRC